MNPRLADWQIGLQVEGQFYKRYLVPPPREVYKWDERFSQLGDMIMMVGFMTFRISKQWAANARVAWLYGEMDLSKQTWFNG